MSGNPFAEFDRRRPIQPDMAAGWPMERVRAVAQAYRAARGLGMSPREAEEMAIFAHMASGGTAEQARGETMRMIQSVNGRHSAWLRRPMLQRLNREEEAMQRLGWWPPPEDVKIRAVWAEEAMQRVFAPPPEGAELDRRYWGIQRRHQAMIDEARRRADAAHRMRPAGAAEAEPS